MSEALTLNDYHYAEDGNNNKCYRLLIFLSIYIALPLLSPEYILKLLQQKDLRKNKFFRLCVRD